MSGDIEAVKKKIAASLSGSAFADALAAVDAEKADGTTTPGLRAVYDYERAVLEAYPAVEVIGLGGSYNPDDDVKNATYQIAIVVTQIGDSEQGVTREVERLVRAARDLFWRGVLDAQEGLTPMLVTSEDYSQLAPSPAGNAFMKGGRVILSPQTLT